MRKCHRFDWYVGDPSINPPKEAKGLELCDDCFRGQEVPVHAHRPVEYQTRYLYILKLDGGEFYAGQTNDLEIRLKEHQDGLTKTTAGKHPKLVWFEKWYGDRDELNAEEDHLMMLAKQNPRAIRRKIAEWQRPIRLVDLDA